MDIPAGPTRKEVIGLSRVGQFRGARQRRLGNWLGLQDQYALLVDGFTSNSSSFLRLENYGDA